MTEDSKIICIRMAEFLGVLAILCLGFLLLAVSLKTMSTIGIVIGSIMALIGLFWPVREYDDFEYNQLNSKED